MADTCQHQGQIARLYTDHHQWLHNWLCRRLRNGCDAPDLLQSTFEQVLRRPQAALEAAEPRAWLVGIARHLVVDHRRRQLVEQACRETLAALPEPLAPSPEEQLAILDTVVRLDAMLAGLGPKVRMAFLLSRLDGLSYGDIAQRLGVSLRTVESWMAKAILRWAVRFESGCATEADRRRFEQWRARHPGHEQAWREVQGLGQELAGLPGAARRLVRDSLDGAEQRLARQGRRNGIKLLGLGALAVLAGGAGLKAAQLSHGEQLATGVGERRSVVLPDGTRLQLNTATQAEVAYGPLRRTIHLHTGEILIDTGADPQGLAGPRDFWVHTRHARLQAIGTRFSVRVEESGTRLHVSSGRVAVHSPGFLPHLTNAGEGVLVRPDPAHPLRPLADEGLDPESWARGALVVRQMPLPRFLAELSRYHAGPAIEADTGAAGLAVSGVFRLDGADPVGRALGALEGTLPIRVGRSAEGVIRVSRR